ncbi:ferrous iron transport protein B [Kineosphaera limosa]|uniref:Ferrous iron transport protein B n=1 Tax=Kineosphaera limosa NBRC 100340 TaxID=1184609 RepID=K6WUM4_9MICO|nr:ferrous iron transporter B [Kineosphaera limosa]NYE00605.1 ferrous iron transport protein B [Kineosphaera limosa]GAB97541.1 ferrous iron transport protein B [Kineosphaera limosa NBRC 100340]
MSASCHGGEGGTTLTGTRRFALVGSPNSGKTTLFNALTGLRAKTGNYPGVTVARYEGPATVAGQQVVIEDLPGTYSLAAISPDEAIVATVLDRADDSVATPDALLVVLDVTTLRRSLRLLAQVLHRDLPVCVVLTFGDEMSQRHGAIDLEAVRRALGVPVIGVVGGRRSDVDALRDLLSDPASWTQPAVLPPLDPAEQSGWVESVLASAGYRVPEVDRRTRRIDAVLLHPVWGTLTFFAVMFGFFQVIFTVAAPMQAAIESVFAWLAALVAEHVTIGWLASFLGQGLIGGVGAVLVFLPQILLLFLLIAVLEGVGYLSRAALLMDRVMARAGLEGRAFVALLSSLACAIPGIMATRTLPSARDRIATMMGAPLMTCSARLPVFVLLIGLLVPGDSRVGPFGLQGVAMFGLYLLGAFSAMTSAWITSRFVGRSIRGLPFYMELPPYRVPRLRSVVVQMWDSAMAFVRKVTTIILATTIIMWALLNLPVQSPDALARAGVDAGDDVAVSQYVIDHSYAADLGKAVQPVFEPLGFDWRINIGILASLSAREVFVATIGQVAAAENPEEPATALAAMTVSEGPRAGEPLFTPPTIAALLMFFVYALQCMSTIAVMRRETGTWQWPAIAFVSLFAVAWVMAFLAHTVVAALM